MLHPKTSVHYPRVICLYFNGTVINYTVAELNEIPSALSEVIAPNIILVSAKLMSK